MTAAKRVAAAFGGGVIGGAALGLVLFLVAAQVDRDVERGEMERAEADS